MTTQTSTKYSIEVVDYDADLVLQCATIQSTFESPSRDSARSKVSITTETEEKSEDELRSIRGTVVESTTQKPIIQGSFFPYEFSEHEQEELKEKMAQLNHCLEDCELDYSFEGTIIRVFYYKKWYISTHRKLNADRSKWGSNVSFKRLFEQGLADSYGLSLNELYQQLNLRCNYTFLITADENTRFVCVPNTAKKVYFIRSNDPQERFITVAKPPKPPQSLTRVEQIFAWVKALQYPYTYQGLLLTHKSGSQYRIINNEYATLFKVRNNEQSIPYRYLQLRVAQDDASIALLKQLFPQYTATFQSHEQSVDWLVDVIYHEYTKRKQRSLLPSDLTTTPQIDQRMYLFIKNKLINKGVITKERIKALLWMEEPSNLNQMIRLVNHMRHVREKSRSPQLEADLARLNLNSSPNTTLPDGDGVPKRKKIKYSKIPVELTFKKPSPF
ncbi:hypothetical protein MIV039R [Invertebrate iridescent virus 3]|uniref:Immediate-early protein ICP-46 homolog n=1 Tax=Invertebrate iridescent virus 3 TaxID=345201 RepID=ICP46_IIV3|nr:hypothetical protein MIV039R [Invertebrate iridescent virus 3]Q197C1.1 RecName: Full=Immediate-early protein ICP-46 homolog [Invertebrate iridescent virus 3]ABF82069.1 hypothetical protein MIV039R [Invertebrate iridescent virus 3]